VILLTILFIENFENYASKGSAGALTLGGKAGDDIIPINWQSASKMVRSLLDPRNRDDSSKSFTLSLTRAPRTYALK
jgi:hypothetical protein